MRVACPLARSVEMSTGTVSHAENLVVRFDGDDGQTGWGEAASAPSMTGETWLGMLAAAQYLAPFVLGSEWPDIASVHSEMDRWLPRNQAVKAAFDIALHDLEGRRTGRPVCQLLGRPAHKRIDVLTLLGTGSLQTDVAYALQVQAAGGRAFKLKVGLDDVAEDAARANAVREALGNGVLLCADANGAWSSADTDVFLSGAVAARLDFVEQPVAPEALETLAGLQQKHGVPLGLDESLRSFEDLRRAHEKGLAQGGSFKLIKAGGLRQLVDAVRSTHQLGLAANLAGKVAETGICTAALLHAAAVSPALRWGCSPSNGYLRKDIVSTPLRVEHGSMAVPEGPGLGVSVDEDVLREFTHQTEVIE